MPGAIEDCNKTIEIDPKCGDAFAFRGWILYNVGCSRNLKEDIKNAKDDLDRAIEIYPDCHHARFDRCQIHIRLGNREMAKQNLEMAIKFAKHDENADLLINIHKWLRTFDN